jgi:hypothetical protein
MHGRDVHIKRQQQNLKEKDHLADRNVEGGLEYFKAIKRVGLQWILAVQNRRYGEVL